MIATVLGLAARFLPAWAPNILSTVWTFVKSPAGKALLILLAFLAWTAYQRHDAAQQAKATCQADQLRADMAELHRQLDAANAVATATRDRADAADTEIKQLEEARDALIDDLKAAGAGQCVLTDSQRSKLLKIRP